MIETIPGIVNSLSSLTGLVKRFFPEVGGFAESLAAAKEDLTVDISPEYRELINRQIEVQTELQEVTFLSNIERSNHETRMAPVRNIRTS